MECSLWKGKGTYNIIHEKKTFPFRFVNNNIKVGTRNV